MPWHDPADEAASQVEAADLDGLRSPLRAFVFSLLPNMQACEEVVQDTLLLLWEKRDEKRSGSNMKAWAFKIARFKVMSWRRDRARENFVWFSDDVLLEIAAESEAAAEEHVVRMEALGNCLAKLREEDLALLRMRYSHGVSLTDLSKSRGECPNRLHKQISRLRAALRHCIEKHVSRSS